jgi:hypothetical protein
MALDNGYLDAVADDHSCGSSGRNILHRAGRSRWWTILAFIPLLNLIGLWVFAFTRWPKAAS